MSDLPYLSEPYRVPRTVLARLVAEEYVRTFWWMIVGIPLFGFIALFVGSGVLQVVGMFAVLWPLTIPARAVLVSWKSGGFFQETVTAEWDGEMLYFHGSHGKGMTLRGSSVRKVGRRHGYALVWYGPAHFAPAPLAVADAMERVPSRD